METSELLSRPLVRRRPQLLWSALTFVAAGPANPGICFIYLISMQGALAVPPALAALAFIASGLGAGAALVCVHTLKSPNLADLALISLWTVPLVWSLAFSAAWLMSIPAALDGQGYRTGSDNLLQTVFGFPVVFGLGLVISLPLLIFIAGAGVALARLLLFRLKSAAPSPQPAEITAP